MQSLKELYKTGKGPSSSHTIGPERIANFIKSKYENKRYKVVLYGSLALTGEGHGTDRVLKEVLGCDTEIVFDTVTTGAANDIQQATRITRAMITQYGMSDKFGMMGLESRESMYLDNGTRLNCSEQMAAEVDQEIMRILRESYEEAKRLLMENREALDKIAEYLIEKETITGKEFMRIFREVKGIPEPTEKDSEEATENFVGNISSEEAGEDLE